MSAVTEAYLAPLLAANPGKPLLVGEDNPYGADPYYALYPLPRNASGHRLCKLVLGLEMTQYLRRYVRVNLCDAKWSKRAAQTRAAEILTLLCQPGQQRPLVLLSAKVGAAFCGAHEPFSRRCTPGTPSFEIVQLPHPSGLCRAWAEPGAYERARAVLRDAGAL